MNYTIPSSKITRGLYYLAIYLLLLFASGFYFHEKGFRIPVLLILSLTLFLASGRKIDVRVALIVLFLCFVIFLSGIFNAEKTRNIILPIVDILCSVMLAFGAISSANRGEFIHIYRRVLIAVAVGSIILYAIGAIASSMLSFLPTFTDRKGDALFAGLSFVYKKGQYMQYRNMGLFWEPGAFQTYLLLGMIFEDCIDGKHKLRNLIILTVAMITTVSTTGLICLLLFWIVYVLKNKKKAISILIGLILLLCCIIVIVYPEILPSQIQFGIVEKLNDLFSGDQELRTVQTRMDSVVYPLQAFWKHPLFGVSKSGMFEWSSITRHALNTCTPINWFAHYGIFMGVILLSGFGKFFTKISKKNWVGLAFWLIFLISISTEAFNYNPTLLCFAFMGISVHRELLPEATINENSFD